MHHLVVGSQFSNFISDYLSVEGQLCKKKKKSPEPDSCYLSLELFVDQFTIKLNSNLHTCTARTRVRPTDHRFSAPGTLASLTGIGCHGNHFRSNWWKAGWWRWRLRKSWGWAQGRKVIWTHWLLTSTMLAHISSPDDSFADIVHP